MSTYTGAFKNIVVFGLKNGCRLIHESTYTRENTVAQMLLGDHPFFPSSQAFNMYAGGRGDELFIFQNLKMTILFQQNHHFLGLFFNHFVHFWGEGGGLQKEYVLYTRENDEKKWTAPK